jgi:hypothetical protein
MEADLLITSYPYIKVRRGNKWGLVDSEGNWILDCKFDEVNANLDFAWGSTKKRTGEILRLSDRKKFAFPYDYIYSLGSFYQVRLGDLNGVIDSTNFKEILPPMFSLGSAEDTLIIGQNTTFQRRIGLDSSRQVIYDLTVPKFREYNTLSNIGHDKRLDAQGWFFEEKERFDKDGFLIDKKKYYGLQNDTGKVIRKPYFTYPRYLANRDYILYFAGVQLSKEGQKKSKPTITIWLTVETVPSISNKKYGPSKRLMSITKDTFAFFQSPTMASLIWTENTNCSTFSSTPPSIIPVSVLVQKEKILPRKKVKQVSTILKVFSPICRKK